MSQLFVRVVAASGRPHAEARLAHALAQSRAIAFSLLADRAIAA
ncbi:hypothetical protein [Trinickia fusca]|nr:hypothetical protein [Trinickia fusca]